MRGDALQDVLDEGHKVVVDEVPHSASRAEVNECLVLTLVRLEAARAVAERLAAMVRAMERPSIIITPQAADALVYRVAVAEQGCRFTIERLESLGVDPKARTVPTVRGHDLADELLSAAEVLIEALAGIDLGPRGKASLETLASRVGRFKAAEVGR